MDVTLAPLPPGNFIRVFRADALGCGAMAGASVFIDQSQFPESVRRDLLESLRSRTINHKFHYESHKQAAKWLALHEAHSPARTDASCLGIYEAAFAATARALGSHDVQVVGLGCGGGQKEARLLSALAASGAKRSFIASDISVPLVLTARTAALPCVEGAACRCVACDLGTIADPNAAFPREGAARRVVTFFGMLPNFEPQFILPRLAFMLEKEDLLLASANLAPGADYGRGVEQVLPQYDNPLTRDWLMALLLDLGFEVADGELRFTIENDARGLRRITAHFHMARERRVRVLGETFTFARGERIRLFFSYRHTTEIVRALAGEFGLCIVDHWINDSGEEGVFLLRAA
jgi:L-histidine Nalpha-methyltransferase